MSSTARSDEWKKYDKNLNKSVALEDLRDAVRKQDEDKVEKAIGRCREAGLQDNEKVKEAAEVHLPIISSRNRLSKACEELKEKGEDEKVKSELKSIKRDGLSPYLYLEMRDAKALLERHEKSKHKPKALSLAMDSKTVAEIRRYQNPPPVLHKVIQGALLLVGEDEDMTDAMGSIEKAQAAADAEKESKGHEKKQKQDPAGQKDTTADKTEKSAAPSDKTSKGHEKKDEEQAKPANRKRQKELFGRLPPPQEDKNFYNMTVSTKKKSKIKTEGNPSKTTTDGKPSKTHSDEQPPKTKMDEQPPKTKMDGQSPNSIKAK